MIKLFCDGCGSPGDITARNFVGIKALGIDVTLTVGGARKPDHHVCIECLANLLGAALKSLPGTAAATEIREAMAAFNQKSVEKRRIAQRETELAEREAAVAERTAECERETAAAKQQAKHDAERIALLSTQLRTLQAQGSLKQRQAAAQAAQEEIDRRDSPEYVAAVQTRETRRAQGKEAAQR